MADAFHHSLSSVKKFGGVPEDYILIHQWFDATKTSFADNRHRAIRHHSVGISECIDKFGNDLGVFYRKSDNKPIPVRWVAEQHVFEDCGFIPSIQDWLEDLPVKGWMNRGAMKLSKILEGENNNE